MNYMMSTVNYTMKEMICGMQFCRNEAQMSEQEWQDRYFSSCFTLKC